MGFPPIFLTFYICHTFHLKQSWACFIAVCLDLIYLLVFKSKEIVVFSVWATAGRLPGRFVQLEIRQYLMQTIIVSANRIISLSTSIKLWIAHSWKIVKGREGELGSQTWYARKNKIDFFLFCKMYFSDIFICISFISVSLSVCFLPGVIFSF